MDLVYHSDVKIQTGKIELSGKLTIPFNANGIILFSHGSGSSRNSPRNQMVAHQLQKNGFGTLLFDLLTEREDLQYQNRFDIELLAERLIAVTHWLIQLPQASEYPLGYFGASTGAASALKAAASLPRIAAVVSRGGRPDLAMGVLDKIKSPTLLIVGSLDYDVLQLNRQAYAQLRCQKQLYIVEGATHLFEEEGMLEKVAAVSVAWFSKYMHPVKEII